MLKTFNLITYIKKRKNELKDKFLYEILKTVDDICLRLVYVFLSFLKLALLTGIFRSGYFKKKFVSQLQNLQHFIIKRN